MVVDSMLGRGEVFEVSPPGHAKQTQRQTTRGAVTRAQCSRDIGVRVWFN